MDVDRSVFSAWRWFLLVPALGCLSCSNGNGALNPVQGRVLSRDQPAAGAAVVFHPKKAINELSAVRPFGLVKEDGTFTMMSGKDPGAEAGEYVVTITWPQEVGPKRRKGEISTDSLTQYEDRLKGAYADRAKSKFETVHVKKGVNQLEPFVLK
jgi:hypothetical protein